MDMARAFPHSEVIGVDVAPVPVDPESVPPNCQFEIDDIQLGLTHFHQPQNQFDLIHARSVAIGIKDFRRTLRDVQCCLKPGGLLIWIELDFEIFTPDLHVYQALGSEANPNGSWTGRIIFGRSDLLYSCAFILTIRYHE
jgi:trans-aconitate methyltransferase